MVWRSAGASGTILAHTASVQISVQCSVVARMPADTMSLGCKFVQCAVRCRNVHCVTCWGPLAYLELLSGLERDAKQCHTKILTQALELDAEEKVKWLLMRDDKQCHLKALKSSCRHWSWRRRRR